MEKIKMKPGIYKNVPFEEYLSWDAFSKSMVSSTLRSTLHLQHYINNDRVQTDAMKFGTLVDTMIFEPGDFEKKYLLRPDIYPGAKGEDKPWTMKANYCKDWVAEAESSNMTVYKLQDHVKATQIIQSLEKHKTAGSWLSNYESQVSIIWEDYATGLLCKGRLDMLGPNMIGDLKITHNASYSEFQRTANNFLYHVQAFMYREGYKTLTGETLPFNFIVAEDSAPHGVATYSMGQESLTSASFLFEKAIRRYQEYLKTGPVGYSDQVQELEIPSWSINQVEESLLEDAQ